MTETEGISVAQEPVSEATGVVRKWSIWWSRIISALLGIAVTVIGSLILSKIQSKEPRLTYSSVETVPFNGQSGVVGIYQVVLRNDGKSEIEGISSYIRIPNSKIDQYRVTIAPSLTATTTANGTDAIKISLPSLNPGETAQVSILASNPSFLPPRPEISVRGKGVGGTEETSTTPTKQERPFFIPLATAVAALGSTSAFYALLRQRRLGFGRLLTSQADDFKTICEMHGLNSRAAQYALVKKMTFYAEADRLGDEAVQSHSREIVSDIKKILISLSALPTMVPESRAIVLYNLARIAASEGSQGEAESYVTRARSISSDEIDGRLRLDPLLKFENMASGPG